MNTKLIAAALHALANAIEAPESAMVAESASPPASTSASDAPKKRGPGRPPKGDETPSPAPAAATPVATAPAATPAATDAKLTHAIVANDFKAAAQAHGVAFVKGMLAQFAKGATFDTVPAELLGKAQAYLKAGPQTAAPSNPVDDLLG